MNGFPLGGLQRRIAEGAVEQAEEFVRIAERAVREGNQGELKEDTDTVAYLMQVCEHLGLCRTVLRIDDDAREGGGMNV